ncbi:hypothetical protein AGMMS49983_21130 [Clostridia bacterium]|nr:hypothetical protein AGMMS49983_21130 [Clostridia bacterium]
MIDSVYFDLASANDNYCVYRPSVHLFNKQIEEWETRGIEFYGLFHTHSFGITELSRGDKEYIKAIMAAMPKHILELYFPLVFSGKRMISYAATRISGEVVIRQDEISLISSQEGG